MKNPTTKEKIRFFQLQYGLDGFAFLIIAVAVMIGSFNIDDKVVFLLTLNAGLISFVAFLVLMLTKSIIHKKELDELKEKLK